MSILNIVPRRILRVAELERRGWSGKLRIRFVREPPAFQQPCKRVILKGIDLSFICEPGHALR